MPLIASAYRTIVDLNDSRIGGTNLLQGTSAAYTTVSLGAERTSLGDRLNLSESDLAPGDDMTFAACLKTNAMKAACVYIATYAAESGSSGEVVYGGTEIVPAGSEGRSALTIRIPEGAQYAEVGIENKTPAVTENVEMEIRRAKLESGEIATDWSPAPADVDENVERQLTSVRAEITNLGDSILSEVSTKYAAKTDLGTLQTQVSTLATQTSTDFTWATQTINQIIADAAANQQLTEEQFETIQTYMMFGEDGLRLGKTGNPVTVRILNDRIAFYMNETEVAYFSNNKLYVTQAQILSRLQIGKFAYEPQPNGNMSLIYTG